MIIKRKSKKALPVGAPLLHEGHKRPVTRREFLGAGMIAGGAAVWTPNLLSLLLPKEAQAAIPTGCQVGSAAGGVPFICFDLGGGSNMTGSNVLVGGPQGQMDFLSVAGYNKLGLPDGMIPTGLGAAGNTNNEFGLVMHSDSAFLRGMLSRTSTAARAGCNGVVIPNLSDNDTGNNPHNPMYLIAKVGAKGKLMDLIGTANTDSGGRSMAGTLFLNPEIRPTKISSRNDSMGLVDTGGLQDLLKLSKAEVRAIMDSMSGISGEKVDQVEARLGTQDSIYSRQVHCAYHKASYNSFEFGPALFNPVQDTRILSGLTAVTYPTNASSIGNAAAIPVLQPTDAIFSEAEIDNNATFRKTSAVMQLVINGNAGAGTIELGGFDYHDGTRATGERRDFEAGAAMGACIEYAHRVGSRLMLYVFTDGSLASNGNVDNTTEGGGKGEWSGDNSSTSAAFFFVYNPTGRPSLVDNAPTRQQLGWYRSSASVETNGTTPGANNVNLLAQMVALNYLALSSSNAASEFDGIFSGPNKHGLGTDLNRWISFNPITA